MNQSVGTSNTPTISPRIENAEYTVDLLAGLTEPQKARLREMIDPLWLSLARDAAAGQDLSDLSEETRAGVLAVLSLTIQA